MDSTRPELEAVYVSQEEADRATKREEEERQRAEDEEIVRRAKEFHGIASDFYAEWREEALMDLEFLAGDQWDPTVKSQRADQGRPALTVNRLPQFVRQVTNEQRQSKPAMSMSPVDSGSDMRTAETLQGVARNIESSSDADAAYIAGGESAAQTGLGFWDVGCEYEDERSFEQKIVIRPIENPLSVLMDPSAQKPAGDDARECILTVDVSKSKFEEEFPDTEIPVGVGIEERGNNPPDWVAKDGVRIHEYRYIKTEPDTLIEDPEGGEPVLASELASLAAQMHLEQTGQPPRESLEELAKLSVAKAKTQGIHTRRTTRRKACWVKIAGDEIIDRGEFAGKHLQLVRVVGTKLTINGRKIYEGVIRHARDPQRILNYAVSSETETIALMPKAPWVGTAKQFEGYENIWAAANQRPVSYLPYNSDPLAPGAPQRVMAGATNISEITNARMQAADDLKATTGIYDGQLGARSNETSGKAILARQSQGQTANFHFQDNLGHAIRYTGRILVDLIPKIYSGARILRILGEDGKPEMVPVNGHPPPPDFKGDASKVISLDAGRYDVTVAMGPSYQSRRQEVVAMLMELIRADPTISAVTRDLLVKSMDIPGGNEIAKRLEKTLDPSIRPPDEGQPPAQMLAMQLQQQGQLVEQLTQELNALREEHEANAQDNAAKKEIELTKLHAQVLMKLAEIDSAQSIALLKAEALSIGQQRRASEAQQQPQPQQPMPGVPIEGGNNGF